MTNNNLNCLIYPGWAHDYKFYSEFSRFLKSDLFSLNAKFADRQIIIAHSIGMHYIEPEIVNMAKLLVLVGCFEKFSDSRFEDFKLQSRIIDRMLAKFKNFPNQVLENFYTNCGLVIDESYPIYANKYNYDDLYNELNFLKNNQFNLKILTDLKIPILIIHSLDDKIINFKRSQLLFDDIGAYNDLVKLVKFDKSSHSLLTTDYLNCYQEIITYYNKFYG